jgi:hypothetical protein
MSASYDVIKVEGGEYCRLKVRRKRIPFNLILELLCEGHEIFIPDMNRKTAHYLKNKISNAIGSEIICFPSEYQGKSGYTFKISVVSEYLSRRSLTDQSIK